MKDDEWFLRPELVISVQCLVKILKKANRGCGPNVYKRTLPYMPLATTNSAVNFEIKSFPLSIHAQRSLTY